MEFISAHWWQLLLLLVVARLVRAKFKGTRILIDGMCGLAIIFLVGLAAIHYLSMP